MAVAIIISDVLVTGGIVLIVNVVVVVVVVNLSLLFIENTNRMKRL